jgi:hypothetical protein
MCVYIRLGYILCTYVPTLVSYKLWQQLIHTRPRYSLLYALLGPNWKLCFPISKYLYSDVYRLSNSSDSMLKSPIVKFGLYQLALRQKCDGRTDGHTYRRDRLQYHGTPLAQELNTIFKSPYCWPQNESWEQYQHLRAWGNHITNNEVHPSKHLLRDNTCRRTDRQAYIISTLSSECGKIEIQFYLPR